MEKRLTGPGFRRGRPFEERLEGLGRSLIATVFLGISVQVPSRTIQVPTDYPSIQTSLDAAGEGDEIIVHPGQYTENIRFNGKNLVLRSTDPTSGSVVAATLIDGGRRDAVVTFEGSEGTTCVLAGFTIAQGRRRRETIFDDPLRGGGINGNGTMATIQYDVVTSNTADEGGGLANCNGLIHRNRIIDNYVYGGSGGGLFDCHGTIRQNTVTDNVAEEGGGGGLSICSGTIEGNTISRNGALIDDPPLPWKPLLNDPEGGGLLGCDGVIRDNLISDNFAFASSFPPYFTPNPSQGGGLFDCDGLIHGNVIIGNEARVGGGLMGCDGVIEGNHIRGNWGYDSGGGISGSGGWVRNNVIEGNYSYEAAGLEDCFRATNNLVVGNYAQARGGGMRPCTWSPRGGAWVSNNVIYANGAGEEGGGVMGSAGCRATVLRNNIIWGNRAPVGPQVSLGVTLSFNCIEGWEGGGDGNIMLDPWFVDAEGGDFHLLPDSACIDAGRIELDVLDDLEGKPRPMDGTLEEPRGDGSGWDIGAFEYPGPLLPLPPPDPQDIVDALLRRLPTRAWMDMDGSGDITMGDVIRAIEAPSGT